MNKTAILYVHKSGNMPFIVARKKFNPTDDPSKAFERQFAEDLAKEHNITEGHVSIMVDGCCVDKLSIML